MHLFKKNNRVYMDYASSTPVDPDVIHTMTDTMKHIYANPSAVHRLGVESHNLLANARKTIADSLGAHSDEIIFTSGGTESDNLAISGVVNAYYQSHTAKPHIITSTIEHAAVLETIRHLEQTGVIEATYVPVDERGLIDMKYLKESLKQRTILVSIIHGNNEIGVIQNIADVAKIVRHFKKNKTTSPQPTPEQEMELDVYPLVHTDACQSYVYMKLVVKKLGIDLITINSSKIYGPKGTGALYKKRHIPFASVLFGGDQEYGLRPGTENLIGIVGFAKAVEINEKIKDQESARLVLLRDYCIKKLKENFDVVINGDETARLPNNINCTFTGYSSEQIVIYLDAQQIYVSEKSACKSDNGEVSHVISALYGDKITPTEGSIRFSLGRQTTKGDIDILILKLREILKLLT